MKRILNIFALSFILVLSSCSAPYIGEFCYPDFLKPVTEGAAVEENAFVETITNPMSTFAVDADGASYSIMRGALRYGMIPSPSLVRIEEYLNYFTFNYAEPDGNAPIAVNGEIGECPWAEGHKLMRLGIKGRSLPDDQLPPSNYVFMIDVSGSMHSNDKLPLFKSGLSMMVDMLRPDDRISIVTYSGISKVVLESVPASESTKIKEVISDLKAEGLTAGGYALKMAYEQAVSNYIQGGNNRIIMGTDGDFNVGVTSTDDLLKIVGEYADRGICMTVCGFGVGINDSMMEKVSNKGNGTYVYIDSEKELVKVFVNEMSNFYSVAKDAKVKVTFDKEYVKSWRLIGYENRIIGAEDFEDDKKDGGEIGAGQTITALYELVPTEKYSAGVPAALFECGCKEAYNQTSELFSTEVSEPVVSARMLPELDFAAGVAAYGMVLSNSKYKGKATLDMAEKLVASGIPFDEFGYRAELLELIGKARGFVR